MSVPTLGFLGFSDLILGFLGFSFWFEVAQHLDELARGGGDRRQSPSKHDTHAPPKIGPGGF